MVSDNTAGGDTEDVREGASRTSPLRTMAVWSLGAGLAVLAVNLLFDRYLFWDSYLDLAAGRYISGHGIPHHEVFTVAARGDAWIDQQWLAHLVYYGGLTLGGQPVVASVYSAAVPNAFGVLTALHTSRGAEPQPH